MNVELHIERLVLEGIDLPQAQHIPLRESVHAELARLVRGGFRNPVKSGFSVSGPSVAMPADGDTAELGLRLAHAIYRGIQP